MNIIIGSDLVPTPVNMKEFKDGNIEQLLGEDLSNIWYSSDYRIFNLETPITKVTNPIRKKGPNFKVDPSVMRGINALKPSLLTLANNHILDHGEKGLLDTIKILNQFNINHIGAGENLLKAQSSHIIKANNTKIGIYTCAEHEFTIATKNKAGANPFDPLESLDHITDLKTKCDYVIVLYHGGKEYYRYPSPYLQKVCRKIVDKGADLVVCQHSHTVGAYENYNNSKIVYGQGNFLFNKNVNEHWNTGLLLNVEINDNLNVKYIPFIRTSKGIKKANNQQEKQIMKSYYRRSEEILDKNFVEENYKNFAEQNFYKYLRSISSQGKWMSRIDRHLFNNRLIKKSYDIEKLLSVQNYIECEAHRELFLMAIKEKLKHE